MAVQLEQGIGPGRIPIDCGAEIGRHFARLENVVAQCRRVGISEPLSLRNHGSEQRPISVLGDRWLVAPLQRNRRCKRSLDLAPGAYLLLLVHTTGGVQRGGQNAPRIRGHLGGKQHAWQDVHPKQHRLLADVVQLDEANGRQSRHDEYDRRKGCDDARADGPVVHLLPQH